MVYPPSVRDIDQTPHDNVSLSARTTNGRYLSPVPQTTCSSPRRRLLQLQRIRDRGGRGGNEQGGRAGEGAGRWGWRDGFRIEDVGGRGEGVVWWVGGGCNGSKIEAVGGVRREWTCVCACVCARVCVGGRNAGLGKGSRIHSSSRSRAEEHGSGHLSQPASYPLTLITGRAGLD